MNSLTEHLDTWSSAIKTKSSAGRGSGKKQEFYGIKKLRELILELAVRGLLVPQDPSDEPSSQLIKRVKKSLPDKKSDNPFLKEIDASITAESEHELPLGWAWLPLGHLGNWATGCGFPKKHQGETDREFLFCKVSDMNLPGNETEIHTTVHSIDGDVVKIIRARVNPVGTVVFPKIGGAIATHKRRIVIKPTIIDNNCSGIQPVGLTLDSWLLMFMRSLDLTKYQSGTSVPAVSQSALDPIRIGLPPIAEQHRIVAKVDELMALCDQLEQQQEDSARTHGTLVGTLLGALTAASERGQFPQAWQRIESNFDTLFTTESSIAQLKQTILQLAVMGKLVEQDPGDEPAKELISKLTLERKRLLKEKQIPKAKKLTGPRDNPYDIPSLWCWIQLGSISHLIEYGTSQKSNDDSSRVPVYRMGDIQDGTLYDGKLKFVPPDIDDLPRLFIEPGDILFNRTNSAELVGKAAIFKGTPNTHTFASYLIRVRVPAHYVDPEFINLCFRSPYFRETQINPEIIQQCGQANFNGTKLAHTLFPLPPPRRTTSHRRQS